MSLLVLDGVSHGYGGHAVLRDMSLVLDDGEIGCLLGGSGCGKTTALRLIAGFEQPDAGAIRLGGTLLAAPGRCLPPERRGVGMVFQDFALFPHLDVAANVGFGLRDKTRAAGRVAGLLDRVGLAGLGGRFPHQLSGGQQQRVALARALAPAPRLLLLDEPFSSLDVTLRERLAVEVRTLLKDSGTAAILVTHDQHEAFAVADRIGVMHAGRIEQWDTPYNLYHRPATRQVADFVGEGAFLPGRLGGNHSIVTELGALDCGVFCPNCAPGSAVDVLLRPDDIVHDDAAPVRAEVVAKAFRGAEFLYTLRLDSGAGVLSLVPSHHDHAPGERIGIRLDANHVVAYCTGSGNGPG
jgi:iron(III) transport system ATP-binding protein